MNLDLNGKVALVTGASRGIGLAIAKGLAAEGARLCIAARGRDALEKAAAQIEAAGGEVLAVACDVADDASVGRLVDAALEHFGRIDILISNASALSVGGERQDWDRSLSVDLMGAVRLVEAVLPSMREQGSGSILLISSVSGVEASPMNDFGYTSAKAALNAYAKKLAIVEGANGIRANALLPGSVEFPGGGWEVMRSENPPIYEMVRSSIPFGRLGRPEEIADAAVWLVSARAGWVTGAALSVDGGQGKGIR
ncbi:SDR family NAD(P)-dependent oxidoreductase [Erythrobacter sp. sf7]|uniref:SDR family NAD(P)-dependent oxidoreductase n=1 Tax=Erythrobacter fulvus TaxID=2987523 RepID=A0ABT5JNV3_9SPHN|nr:SDR family NAD(P)-dependent oxidoreductase [Erythrobacter fulvus]MDC8754462.1 SDR family NAD(P)-dependent oxidoreductase [Erythrobacter fulvus]